jgi:polyphosphate glucokinase
VTFVGVDVGGTGIKAGLVDTDTGALVGERIRVLTPEGGAPEAVIAEIARVVGMVGADGPIGVGLPGPLSAGRLMMMANLDPSWVGLPAEEMIATATGREVVLVNDADAAGLAEMRFGAGAGCHGVVLMLTLGTGIGSALFVDGHLVPNTEFGHIEVRGKDGEDRAAPSVRERKGLSWAAWVERLNEYIDHIDKLVWPDRIILGGGISKNPEKFMPMVRARPPIVTATLQNNAGIVGSALRVAETLSRRSAPQP